MNDGTVIAGGCQNCGSEVGTGDKFCRVCGQKTPASRLSLHHIFHDLLHAFVHVDRSVLSLAHSLLFRPGGVARDYVEGKRQRYYGPFAFLVVVVAFTSATIALSGFQAVSSSAPNAAASFFQHHINLVFFAQVPLMAALCRVFSGRGNRYNYAEYLVLVSYTSAMHILFYAIIIVPAWYVFRPQAGNAERLYYLYAPLWPVYFGYALSQFQYGNRVWGALKGIIAVLATQALTLLAISGIVNAYLRYFAQNGVSAH